MSKKRISGTREWAEGTANCVDGCKHDCRYCYAKYNMCDRFKKIAHDDWTKMVVRPSDVSKKRKKFNGPVMFPTTHDICPEVLDECIEVIGNVLEAGNNILIVSKPNLESIKKICDKFKMSKNNILFRFTVGAFDDKILSYWEPGAPNFEERFESLKYAFAEGFNTSISAEPMLDGPNVVELFNRLEPFVNDAIWIGKMNNIRNRVKVETDEDEKAVMRIENGQKDECIRDIYDILKDHPKVKWKESFKEVLGIDLATETGLDE